MSREYREAQNGAERVLTEFLAMHSDWKPGGPSAGHKAFEAAKRALADESRHDPRATGHFVLPHKTKSLSRTADCHQTGVNAKRQQQKTRLLKHLKSLTRSATMQHVEQLLQLARPCAPPRITPMLARALSQSDSKTVPQKMTRADKRIVDDIEFGLQNAVSRPNGVDGTTTEAAGLHAQMTVVLPTGVVRTVHL